MLRTVLAAAAFAAAGLGSCGQAAAADGTLAAQRWQKRILLVFADEADPRAGEQAALLLGDEPGLADRDLLAFAVVGDALRPIYGRVPAGETAEGLRRRFAAAPPPAFTAILIGKDGGVKWRGDRPATREELFGLIDAMPMRRNGLDR